MYMYRKILLGNTVVIEVLGSFLLALAVVIITMFYLQDKGMIHKPFEYIQENSKTLERSNVVVPYSTDDKTNILHAVGKGGKEVATIARQVVAVSFSVSPTIPVNNTVKKRVVKKKSPENINYARLNRYSPLHRAYEPSAVNGYERLEAYLLEYLHTKPLHKKAKEENIVAMKKYILHINPVLENKYVDTVARKIVEVANKYNLPFALLGGLIGTESTYNKTAVSNVGATGLTQVYPKVWKKTLIQNGLIHSVNDLFTVEKNIEAGAYILSSYYTLGRKLNHSNPLRYALHRYYGARDNSYVQRVYRHSKGIAHMASLLS